MCVCVTDWLFSWGGSRWPLPPLYLASLLSTASQRGENGKTGTPHRYMCLSRPRASGPTQGSRGQPALVSSNSWPFIFGFLMLGGLSASMLGTVSLGHRVRLAVVGWASRTGPIYLIKCCRCQSSSHIPTGCGRSGPAC